MRRPRIKIFRSSLTINSLWQLPLILLSLISFALPAIACDNIDPADCIPIDGDCPNWLLDGELRTAYTFQELTEIINGGASFYWDYGFVGGAFQNYTLELPGDPTIGSLNLYNLGTPENASALYADPGSGSGDPIVDWPWPGEARLSIGYGIATLQFREECFFGSFLILPGDESNASEALCPSGVIITKILGSTPVYSQSWGSIKQEYNR